MGKVVLRGKVRVAQLQTSTECRARYHMLMKESRKRGEPGEGARVSLPDVSEQLVQPELRVPSKLEETTQG